MFILESGTHLRLQIYGIAGDYLYVTSRYKKMKGGAFFHSK